MRAYFATKLSPNISQMPNGFLVCKNVPIARTGTQEYRGEELGIKDRPDELFTVYRDEQDVFDKAALASFEGNPLVDEHPPDDVTVNNAGYLMRGFVKDVRRGEGEDADKVMADIIVTDPTVISEIESGKREISCGYKCDYVEADERIYQRNIRGNHIALVSKGRAGRDVAIRDSEPQITERRTMFMKTKENSGGGILAKLLGITVADADPAVVAEVAEHLLQAPGEEASPVGEAAVVAAAPTDAPPASDEPPAWAASLIAEVASLGKTVRGLVEAKASSEDPLDALEEELAVGEEEVTVPVEEIEEGADAALDVGDGAADEADVAADEADTALDETPASDAKDAIATAKKAVASIPDAATRKVVSDSMAGLIRQMHGVKTTTAKDSYAKILQAKQSKAKDAAPAFDDMEARQAAYDKRNPHFKQEVK